MDFTESIRLDPDNVDPYHKRGAVRANLGDLQGVIADYSEAIRLGDKSLGLYFGRADAKSDLGDNQGALSDYSEAIRLYPDASTYTVRGNFKESLGDKQGAIADYTQAISLDNNYALAYSGRGVINADLNLDEARKDFEKAAELYKQQGDMENYNSIIGHVNKLKLYLLSNQVDKV